MIIDIKNSPDNVKIDILISALSERYASMHAIRQRVQETGVWALGLTLGAGGWVISSTLILTDIQKAIYATAIAISFYLLRFSYLSDLSKGFKSQQRAAARIEDALGLYSAGLFDSSTHSIYAAEWIHAGTAMGDGRFFRTTYRLIYLATAFALIAIVGKSVFF